MIPSLQRSARHAAFQESTLCTPIWGEESHHTETEVNHLIWELCKKLAPDPKEPKFLETVRGLGYHLVTRSFSN